MTNEEIQYRAVSIYEGYKNLYGFPQGLCMELAVRIRNVTGGAIVAGTLNFGGCARDHWWVELESGQIIDPMSDDLAEADPHCRMEHYRIVDFPENPVEVLGYVRDIRDNKWPGQ